MAFMDELMSFIPRCQNGAQALNLWMQACHHKRRFLCL